MSKKNITQPSLLEQVELMEVVEEAPDYVLVREKKWKVGWVRNGTLTKISSLLLSNDLEVTEVLESSTKILGETLGTLQKNDTLVCRAAAYLRLDSWWKIKLFHWLLWRWYYYVKEYREIELCGYIAACKKKANPMGYLGATTYLTAMKTTRMMMTRAEVEHSQAELFMEQQEASQRNTEN